MGYRTTSKAHTRQSGACIPNGPYRPSPRLRCRDGLPIAATITHAPSTLPKCGSPSIGGPPCQFGLCHRMGFDIQSIPNARHFLHFHAIYLHAQWTQSCLVLRCFTAPAPALGNIPSYAFATTHRIAFRSSEQSSLAAPCTRNTLRSPMHCTVQLDFSRRRGIDPPKPGKAAGHNGTCPEWLLPGKHRTGPGRDATPARAGRRRGRVVCGTCPIPSGGGLATMPCARADGRLTAPRRAQFSKQGLQPVQLTLGPRVSQERSWGPTNAKNQMWLERKPRPKFHTGSSDRFATPPLEARLQTGGRCRSPGRWQTRAAPFRHLAGVIRATVEPARRHGGVCDLTASMPQQWPPRACPATFAPTQSPHRCADGGTLRAPAASTSASTVSAKSAARRPSHVLLEDRPAVDLRKHRPVPSSSRRRQERQHVSRAMAMPL